MVRLPAQGWRRHFDILSRKAQEPQDLSDGSLEILDQLLIDQLERRGIVLLKEFSPVGILDLSDANESVDFIEVEYRFTFPSGVVRDPPRIELPSIGLLDAIM